MNSFVVFLPVLVRYLRPTSPLCPGQGRCGGRSPGLVVSGSEADHALGDGEGRCVGITAFPRFRCFSPALLGVGAAAWFSWWFPNKQPTSWLSVIRVAGGCGHLCSSLPVLTTLFVLPISLGRSPLIFSVQHIWEKHIFLSYRNGLLCFLRLKRKAFLDPNTDLKNHLNSSYIAGERAILVVMGGTF